MGTPVKSEQEHWLQGTAPQSPKVRPVVPSYFEGGRPKYPKHLSKVAKQEFKRVVGMLEERKTCTPGDYAALALYAECFARWISCKRSIGDQLETQTTVLDRSGVAHHVTKVNPLLRVLATTEARLLSLIKALGLSPVDREKAKPTNEATSKELKEGTVAWIIQQAEKDEIRNGRPV